MLKILFSYFAIAILLTSCSSPLFAAPTPTSTPVPSSTPTFTPSPTSTFTPSPTATQTLIPTVTNTLSPFSVQSREQFEERVNSGVIKCQGSGNGGSSSVLQFIEEVAAAGLIQNVKYTLGSGIPSSENPSQCLFLMTFSDGNKNIIYKDSETGEYVILALVD